MILQVTQVQLDSGLLKRCCDRQDMSPYIVEPCIFVCCTLKACVIGYSHLIP